MPGTNEEEQLVLVGQPAQSNSWTLSKMPVWGVLGLLLIGTLGVFYAHVHHDNHPVPAGRIGYMQNKDEVDQPFDPLMFQIMSKEKEPRVVTADGACRTLEDARHDEWNEDGTARPTFWRIQMATMKDKASMGLVTAADQNPPGELSPEKWTPQTPPKCLVYNFVERGEMGGVTGMQVLDCTEYESNELVKWEQGLFRVKTHSVGKVTGEKVLTGEQFLCCTKDGRFAAEPVPEFGVYARECTFDMTAFVAVGLKGV